MEKEKSIYTVVITEEAAKLFKDHGFDLLLNHSTKGFSSFKCTTIDQMGPYLKMQVFIEKADVVVDFQIPHHYVLYIYGERDKKIGFLIQQIETDEKSFASQQQ